jgi:probable rRNA maturation factor
MSEPPSPTLTAAADVVVVGADEQDDVPLELRRWTALAEAALRDEGRSGELTLTFVDQADIAELNAEHLGHEGPTDVLSFPLDTDDAGGLPVLLGDVVICPAVAAAQASGHAGSVDDELALLVVHGVLHVLGHDHATDAQRARMQSRERELLERHHWHGPAPARFRQDQDES